MIRRLFPLAIAALIGAPHATGAQPAPVGPGLPPESRQFDFWVGDWDVNLRVFQDDLTWLDAREARANIFPILRGKAVLELWDEAQIKGFSLRYFDPAQDSWVLWLNWPSASSSGVGSLTGQFRHGRGEFYSRSQLADGQSRVTRYSFSDITEESLRWDDAFSNDGGRTWTHQWIMEFTRARETASLPVDGGPAHTWVAGQRCPATQFRAFDSLVGRWSGTLGDVGGDLTGYAVLDGCAVIAMIGPSRAPGAEAWFGHFTYNTRLDRLELLELDENAESTARTWYGREGSTDLVLFRPGIPALERVRIEVENGMRSLIWESRTTEADPWVVAQEGRFGGA